MKAPLAVEDLALAVACVPSAAWSRMHGRRIFVSGGTGFVGKWLVATLLQAADRFDLDCTVRLLTRDPRRFAAEAPHLASDRRIKLLQGDVRDFDAPSERFDVVVHAATDVMTSSAPLDTFDTCVRGTRRILDFAVGAGATDFLLVSSGAVYGRQPSGQSKIPEDHAGGPDPLDAGAAYAQGKCSAEWLSAAYAQSSGLQVRVARLFAFVGPYLPLGGPLAIGNFLADLLARRPIAVKGDGRTVRSYMHAAEMAGWIWAILLGGRLGQAYNVGSEEAVTIGELAARIGALGGLPVDLAPVRAEAAGNPPHRYIPDTGKMAEELGLTTRMSLDQSLERTLDWLEGHGS